MHDNRRTRLVLGVLLIIAITLITLDFKDGGASPVRGLGADIFGPIERVTHDVTDPVASVFDSITGGAMYLPPEVLNSSLIRPVIRRKPSASTSPLSPVRSHPSSVSVFAVSSGRLW